MAACIKVSGKTVLDEILGIDFGALLKNPNLAKLLKKLKLKTTLDKLSKNVKDELEKFFTTPVKKPEKGKPKRKPKDGKVCLVAPSEIVYGKRNIEGEKWPKLKICCKFKKKPTAVLSGIPDHLKFGIGALLVQLVAVEVTLKVTTPNLKVENKCKNPDWKNDKAESKGADLDIGVKITVAGKTSSFPKKIKLKGKMTLACKTTR